MLLRCCVNRKAQSAQSGAVRYWYCPKWATILPWELRKETERDTRFVETGRCLCEVRAGKYWRLEDLKCFDEFLDRHFSGSRWKAY